MYKNHNNYHPSNLHFLSLPPSLKFSLGTQQYYELVHQNNYLGNKFDPLTIDGQIIKPPLIIFGDSEKETKIKILDCKIMQQ